MDKLKIDEELKIKVLILEQQYNQLWESMQKMERCVSKIDKMETSLGMIYVELIGNGQEGLLKKWFRLEGNILALKCFAGGGGIIGIVAFIITLIQYLGG